MLYLFNNFCIFKFLKYRAIFDIESLLDERYALFLVVIPLINNVQIFIFSLLSI